MTASLDSALVWFRRDLRVADHAALYHALRSARRVWCAFVFDRDILDPLLEEGRQRDRRVEFIHACVAELDAALRSLGAAAGTPGVGLIVRHGAARHDIVALATELHVQAVYANHDDEPAAHARDDAVRGALAARGIALHTSKDHVVFERDEVLTASGHPFSVFTPYKNAWLKKVDAFYLKAYPVERYAVHLAPTPPAAISGATSGSTPAQCDTPLPSLASLGFAPTNLAALKIPTGSRGAHALFDDFQPRIDRYDETRDFPGVKGPSYLSVHLRFGTISIRELARAAWQRVRDPGTHGAGAMTWLGELVWRDFYHQILFHHPRVVTSSFKPEYDRIKWEHGAHAQSLFQVWCDGRTGYPLVDAAMAQINQTGYMHNRLRMVVASFLVKDLGIDWRWGERYFALHLNDFDLAANNGGWQWAASTGCDAQPWFRIFNPVAQSRKFDPQAQFIRRYLPALAELPDALVHAPWEARAVDLAAAGIVLGKTYPLPLVKHDEARQRTLKRYAIVKEGRPKGSG
jgi:deoxyribodipyrimidine photo-lyase